MPSLESVGITINVVDIPSISEYKEATRKYYGEGGGGQFWAEWIRPIFFPKRHKILYDRWIRAKTQVEIEFINLVIEKGQVENENNE